MSLRTLCRLFFILCFLAAHITHANASPALSSNDRTSTTLKPVAIVYFNNGSSIAKDHAAMITKMAHEASSSLGLTINEYILSKEEELADQVEKIADTDTGLIVIIDPHDVDALMKIPSLYPDIKFTVIDVNKPLYLTNVRSMLFKEQEGIYLMGYLSAIHSKSGRVSFISQHDDERSRNLAYAFLQGIRYSHTDVYTVEQLGSKTAVRSSNPSARLPDAREITPDIVFVLDEDLLETTLHNAKLQKHLVISYNHNLTSEHPGLILTSLVKHYDLAIYHTLRSYKRNEWREGSESMGIGNSYMDYVLDSENKNFISKEMIDQIEMVKDYVSQGILQIPALPQ